MTRLAWTLIATIAALVVPASASAADKTFDDSTGEGKWNTAANWTTDGRRKRFWVRPRGER